MKRHWVLVEDDRKLVSEYDECFSKHNRLTFTSERDAEEKARELAEENPGTKYSVFSLVSSFVVNIMTEERVQ